MISTSGRWARFPSAGPGLASDPVSGSGIGQQLSVSNQCQKRSFHPQPFIGIVFHPILAQPAGFLQLFKNSSIELGILAAHLAHGFAAAGSETVRIHGRAETSFIHIQILFTGNIAGDLERQAIRGV